MILMLVPWTTGARGNQEEGWGREKTEDHWLACLWGLLWKAVDLRK